MTCPNCGTPNEAGRKFCHECGTRLAAGCPACGTPNPPTARFCGECGTALAGGTNPATAAAASGGLQGPLPAPATDGRFAAGSARMGGGPAAATAAERRLVSVLFADLVGFTTLAEGRDPEHVRELLNRYFDLAREVIERHGGVVEKFIGDAVMALWGAPIAHEDDAERAVRAGLELVKAVPTLGPTVEARVGVLTGEAAITIGAVGQGMVAGDLVNTASRLQSVAPPGTVLVGEATQRAAGGAIAFESVGEQALKGKVAPVPAWRAIRVVAERRGRGREDRLEAPFVGRDAELRLLKDLFHATSRERRVRLVSITGQAGIGKSRLAWEFLKYVDGVVDRVYWHEGRSPAYGEGITFWALGEMIRSRADLLETDDEATSRQKVEASVARYVPDEGERQQITAALLALLGVGDARAASPDELFGAWRTYFERVAADGVVALLFEDLHWADPGLLDFIDHLLDWSRNVPILIVTLARPELLERRPGWGAGRRNFLALDLEPLDELSMRELLAGLVPGLPEPAVRSIVARAEGIPLYAVETIRMLVADGRLRDRPDGGYEPAGDLGELSVPETLHALIAARLDALDPLDRSLVQDAAVLGQSFAVAGLAAVAGIDPATAETRLLPLIRAELLRQESDPRSPERGQYAFVQALIREVAYSTLSLRDRRARHLAAARYFEALGDDELAGGLAVHYLAAFRAVPEGEEADALAVQARLALRAAADRATALGAFSQAVTFHEQALEVTRDPADRAGILEAAGSAAASAARSDQAVALLTQAVELREQGDDRRAIAGVIARLGEALVIGRRPDAAVAVLEPAVERFADLERERVGVELASRLATALMRTSEYDRGLGIADRAMLFAERGGLRDVAIETLIAKGQAYGFQGRMWEARALYEGARKMADEAGLRETALRALNNLAFEVALDDPRAAVDFQREALAIARRLGRRVLEITILGNLSEDARRVGEWDALLAEIDTVLAIEPGGHDVLALRVARQLFLVWRDAADDAELERIRELMAAIDDRDLGASMLDILASIAYGAGRYGEAARSWLDGVDSSDLNAPYLLPRVGHAAVLAGDVAGARGALDRLQELGTRGRAVDADRTSIAAGIAALEGDAVAALSGYRAAMGAWRELRTPWDEALTAFEAVVRLGPDEPEVRGWADGARAIFERLGARPMLARLDEALGSGSGAGGSGARGTGRPSARASAGATGSRSTPGS